MTSVLLDANALMMPVELDVRVFDELDRLLGVPVADVSPVRTGAAFSEERPPDDERARRPERADESVGVDPATPRAVYAELEKLSGGHGREATAASVGADLARERCRLVEHEASYADDAIVELASGSGSENENENGNEAEAFEYVVTNDRALADRLLARGIPVIELRDRNRLAISRT